MDGHDGIARNSVSPEVQTLLERAAIALERSSGRAVRLVPIEQLSEEGRRNRLLKCRVDGDAPDLPASVIIKEAHQGGYNPDDPTAWQVAGLFREWTALEFLQGLEAQPVGFPRFYGGNREAGFLVMQDLTGGEDLDRVLTCGSAAQAERWLVRLAESLGRMHAATVGRSDEYQQFRDRLGPGDRGPRWDMAEHLRGYAPKFAERCRQLGFSPAESFFDEVENVAAVMETPGPFLCFTHGDPCPDNSLLRDGRIALIDFEFSGFRHALLDGVYGRVRFPSCWCVRDIPEAVVETMDAAYRRELASGCPAALDEALYRRAVADACGYWVFENLAHLLSSALEYEQPQGTSTNRQRLLMRLAAFLRVAEQAGHLPGLLSTMGELLIQLQKHWTDRRPQYDAFHQAADVGVDELAACLEAIESANVDQLRALLQHNPGLAKCKGTDADQTPTLYLAVERQQAEAVQLLLEYRADWRITTRSGWTVLARACAGASTEIVDQLLQRGADLNQRDMWGSLPIYGAMQNPEMLRFLFSRGAEMDLKVALDLGRLDVTRQLLEEQPERARFRFGTGVTLLHDLARGAEENLAAMQLLVTAGADVNALTNWRATPLHLAAFNGRARTVAFLLEREAEVNPRDNRGQTPLALAVQRKHLACAEVLRRHGGKEHR